jgi:acetylornithine deacetylase/succinyl-diaminopimelate desuccinylase-like protein
METLVQKINQLAEKYRDYTATILSDIVKVRSLSGEEEQVQQILKRYMEDAGFDEVFFDGLGNLIGRIGNGSKILAIDAHIDTVDVGNLDNWDFDPFSGEIKDGYVWGRGSVDQEGGAAAFITAGRILKELGFDRDLTVYFTATVMRKIAMAFVGSTLSKKTKLNQMPLLLPNLLILTSTVDIAVEWKLLLNFTVFLLTVLRQNEEIMQFIRLHALLLK